MLIRSNWLAEVTVLPWQPAHGIPFRRIVSRDELAGQLRMEPGAALALFFGVAGALTAIGPIAGGYLIEWTWRAIDGVHPGVLLRQRLRAGTTVPASGSPSWAPS